MITSLRNPRVQNAIQLREARNRREQQRLLIDGVRELRRAIDAGVIIEELFYCPALAADDRATALLQELVQAVANKRAAHLIEVSEAVFAKLAFGHRAEGVVAIATEPQRRLDDFIVPAIPLIAVLENLEKPGNIGAILRSADGAGLDGVIVADPRTDLYNPNAIRASLGTIFSMPIVPASSVEAIDWIVRSGLQIIASRVDGGVSYTKIDFRRPTAIVLGSEANGLSTAWMSAEVIAASLPMLGTADSLNVSTAAAILFYEARRQRSQV